MYRAQCDFEFEFECEHTPTLKLKSVFRSERGSRTLRHARGGYES